jgi:hypothetical protein
MRKFTDSAESLKEKGIPDSGYFCHQKMALAAWSLVAPF